jgi:hypothetical protein
MNHFYLDPAQHDYAAIFVDPETGTVFFIDRDLDNPDAFYVQDVNPADVGKVTAAIQREYGARERGGNPDHDCTGRPFRYAASVQSWTDEISGLVFIFFQPSGWQFDI